jgi:hypothetical protein
MNFHNDKVGLCRSCGNARVIKNERGSAFYLCRLAESDPRFPKYPRLPVLSCDGYAAISPSNEKRDE